MNPTRYFRQFMDLSRPGIFVLVDNRHKAVAIFHTKDLLWTIGNTLSAIKAGKHRCKKLNDHKKWLSLHILETVEDMETRYLRYEHWVAHYKKLGYRMFFYKKALQYRVKVDVRPDFTGSDNHLVYVNLINIRYQRKCVGVFNTMEEAKAWVEATYRPMEQIIPVYAPNDLTKEYFKHKEHYGNSGS